MPSMLSSLCVLAHPLPVACEGRRGATGPVTFNRGTFILLTAVIPPGAVRAASHASKCVSLCHTAGSPRSPRADWPFSFCFFCPHSKMHAGGGLVPLSTPPRRPPRPRPRRLLSHRPHPLCLLPPIHLPHPSLASHLLLSGHSQPDSHPPAGPARRRRRHCHRRPAADRRRRRRRHRFVGGRHRSFAPDSRPPRYFHRRRCWRGRRGCHGRPPRRLGRCPPERPCSSRRRRCRRRCLRHWCSRRRRRRYRLYHRHRHSTRRRPTERRRRPRRCRRPPPGSAPPHVRSPCVRPCAPCGGSARRTTRN